MTRPILLAAVAAALALTPTASAYTVVKVSPPEYGDPPRLTLEGTDEPSQITLGATRSGRKTVISITDPVGRLVAGRNCVAPDDHTITCTAAGRWTEFDGKLEGGDDSVTVTGPQAEDFGWAWIELDTGDGTNRADISATSAETGYTFLTGGDGPDELVGGPSRDRIYGADGDDLLTGGPGEDRVSGGRGADRLTGDDGPDYLEGDAADTRFDGGEGNDQIDGTHPLAGACGNGRDVVWLTRDVSPGPLVDAACERVCLPSRGYEDCVSSDRDGRMGEARPTVSGDELTFHVRSPCDLAKCRGRLQLRWQGRLVASEPFVSRYRLTAVRLTVPAALADAIAQGPQELALRMAGIAIRGQDYPYRLRKRSAAWRVLTG